MDANKHMKTHKHEESLNVFSFFLELQGGSEEIPKQILHHDAQTEGEEHGKTSSAFFCLDSVCEGSHMAKLD